MQGIEYTIGETTYVQAPLVFGQIEQLMPLLAGVVLSVEATPETLVAGLGNKLMDVLAVVLTPKGQAISAKNLSETADSLRFAITPEVVFQVIDDFFTCNPIALILEKFQAAVGKIKTIMPATGLKTPFVSCPVETSLAEAPSSGDALQPIPVST